MTPEMFWDTFWSNFLATLFGAILGIVGGYLISKILNSEENKKAEIRKAEEEVIQRVNVNILEAEKRVLIVGLVEIEVNTNISIIKKYIGIDKIDTDKPFPIFKTDYWELIKSSGEITNLFGTNTIQYFSNLYFLIESINKLESRMIGISDYTHAIPQSLVTKFFDLINEINEIDKKNSISKFVHKEVLFQKSILKKFKDVLKEAESIISKGKRFI